MAMVAQITMRGALTLALSAMAVARTAAAQRIDWERMSFRMTTSMDG